VPHSGSLLLPNRRCCHPPFASALDLRLLPPNLLCSASLEPLPSAAAPVVPAEPAPLPLLMSWLAPLSVLCVLGVLPMC